MRSARRRRRGHWAGDLGESAAERRGKWRFHENCHGISMRKMMKNADFHGRFLKDVDQINWFSCWFDGIQWIQGWFSRISWWFDDHSMGFHEISWDLYERVICWWLFNGDFYHMIQLLSSEDSWWDFKNGNSGETTAPSAKGTWRGLPLSNNVLLVKIEGPLWYTIYHHFPVVKGVN